MESHITASEAARSFSDLLNRVFYRGESFVVERGGTAICRIGPAGASHCTLRDLATALARPPGPDQEFAKDVRTAVRKQGRAPRNPWAS